MGAFFSTKDSTPRGHYPKQRVLSAGQSSYLCTSGESVAARASWCTRGPLVRGPALVVSVLQFAATEDVGTVPVTATTSQHGV